MAQLKDTTITGNIAITGSANITGASQSNGNITLYTASGDSPAIIFQRGTQGDTLNDYKVYDTGGHLVIKQCGNSGTSAFTEVGRLSNAGVLTVSTPPSTDTTPSTQAWISPTDSAIKISTDATIASGDKLVIRDTSDADKMRSTSITFGSSTTTFLANNGTWQSAGVPQTATVSVPYQLWGSNTDLPITVTGMTSSATVWVSPNPSSATNIDNYNNAKLYCSAQATDSLTFTYAGTKPTADISVNVVWIK